ncbi:MAG: hypothetical protein J6P40_05990, partial [Oscillospiraceae bacterium]|nr:hypothetical protein [Oscillospiraceae bacterium]
RKQILWPYLQYGCIAAAIALPKLAGFTFSQAFQHGEGHHSFMVFQFNWVNNPSGKGMRDFYLWFYIKNIGIPFIILLLAVFEKDSRQRRLFSEMVLIVVAAETIRFQPNEYDNNKLFYLAWMIGCMIVSNWIAHVWHLLKNLRGRTLMAAGTAVVFFLSPVLTILRECVSSYQAFSAAAVESGEYARNHTEENAVFLTGTQHLNPISAIAGRTIVCGPDLWLYWHGFDTTERKIDIQNFFENPEGFSWVLEKYDAKYIYVSSYERNSYEINETALERMFEVQFRNNEAIIYRVTEPETD